MARLFTCIWIPENIGEKILKFQEKMKKLPMKAKFVEPENLHITTTFLGNVNEDEIKPLTKKLDNVIKDMKKFHVKLEKLKIIPSENYIRVMGIRITDNENLVNLIKKIANTINGKYYTTAKLTLCRVKNVFDKQSTKNFIEKNQNVKFGEFEVNSVSLVKSTLTKGGPIYETIHISKLK